MGYKDEFKTKFINDTRMIEVTAAELENEGKLLIARRPPGDKLEGKWEFPGGKIEDGETPELCLARELFEEFEIEVEVGPFLISSEYHYEHCSVRLMAYDTRLKAGLINPKFHDAIEWAELNRLKEFDFAPADIPIVSHLLGRK